MGEFNKTSVTNLTKIWIDLMRPHTQHIINNECKEWRPSQVYNKTIDAIEAAIAKKLEINLVETKVMLNYKKRTNDAKEKRYFQRKKNKIAERKKKKYLSKLNEDMGEIQNAVFNAHHAIVKLQPIIETVEEEEEEQ